MIRLYSIFALFICASCVTHNANALLDIHEIKTSRNISAWLVEDHQLPIITIRFGWRGGGAHEHADMSGMSYLLAELLNEGGGTLSRDAFQRALSEYGINFSVGGDYDSIEGVVRLLRKNRRHATRLIRAALTAPYFDADILARIKHAAQAQLQQQNDEPAHIADLQWRALAFGDHPYGRSTIGTKKTLTAITIAQLQNWHIRHLARDNLVVAITGAINPREASKMLDNIFGTLPAKHKLPPAQTVTIMPRAQIGFIERAIGQTTIVFGHGGISYDDPQFYAAYVMNHILGGAGLTSRLMEVIRNQNGLAYSVYAGLYNFAHSTAWYGQLASAHDGAQNALTFLRKELTAMRDTPIAANVLADAKTYLIGSYVLRFNSNAAIAEQLFGVQWDRLGLRHFTTRNAKIEAVRGADIQAAARRLLQPDQLIIGAVGKIRPE